MSVAVTMPSLNMMTSIVSEELLARDTHTHVCMYVHTRRDTNTLTVTHTHTDLGYLQ